MDITPKMLKDAENLVRKHPGFRGEVELTRVQFTRGAVDFPAVQVAWTDGEGYSRGFLDSALLELHADPVEGLAAEALCWLTLRRHSTRRHR